jgi:two-component system response regulator ChvI
MPKTSRTIALVDDEESILTTVGFALRKEGYDVTTYSDGLDAWEAWQSSLPDLAVLDIVLPGIDGLELCRRLQQLSPALPVIFLTSRDEEFDKVLGLELGADDYLCKPFSIRELVVRVKVLFRRLEMGGGGDSDEGKVLQVGALILDSDRYEASWAGESIRLTVTEFRILQALARHPGHVKTREQLIGEGYQYDTFVSERTIDSHIKRLRSKIGKLDPGFSAIETVHGLGYRYREK